MLKQALQYASRGLPVFPIAPGTKNPLKESSGFKEATTDNSKIKKWWSKHPNANIAIATGHVSGLFVLDVDNKDGKDGNLSLSLLEDANRELPQTVRMLTPSGSYQLWFKMPKDVNIRISADKLGPGLDIRANGGYTMAPPSRLRKTQKYNHEGSYEFYCDQSLDDMEMQNVPQWLIDKLIEEEPNFSVFKNAQKSDIQISCHEVLLAYGISGLKSSNGVLYGAHPVHGSSNGKNFVVDTSKNLWHCFRHNTGGSALMLIGLLEGILECHDCIKGGLRGKQYKEVVKIAVDRFGFNPKLLFKDKKGVIWDRAKDSSLKPTYNNCMNFMEIDSHFSNVFYNEFCHSVFYNNQYLCDDHLMQIKSYLREKGFEPSTSTINEAITSVALNNKRNPVVEYLKSLKWDGQNRIDTWLIDYCGAKDTAYTRKISKMTLVAAVYRAMEPGTKYDYMLLLEGRQGIKKSTMIETLGSPEFFSEANLLDRGKDIIQQIQSAWFVEIAELAAFQKKDINSLKAFIVRKIDEQRFAYHRHITRVPRSFILIGSINPESNGYLRDTTGNRRFLPVEVDNLDVDGVRRDRDQLFAEAVCAYQQGYKLYFTEAEKHILDDAIEEQKKREQHDEWSDVIYQFLQRKSYDIGNKITCLYIWQTVFAKDANELGWSQSRRIGNCLLSLGAKPPNQPERINGVLGRYYDISSIMDEIKYSKTEENVNFDAPQWDE